MKTITANNAIKAVHGIEINRSMPCATSNYNTLTSRNVQYIVMHYTGNPKDTAKANATYFMRNNAGASAHYFVDDTSIYQSVAPQNKAWSVGGTSTYKHPNCRNSNSISIEMCCSGNYTISTQTELNAAYLCAELCKMVGIAARDVDIYVLRHYDVWSKDCPKGWTGASNQRWNGFKDQVKMILLGESEEKKMKDIQGHYAEKHIQRLLNAGIVNGYDDGTFKPDKPITRADVAIIAANLLNYIGR